MYGIRHDIERDFPEFNAEISRLKHNDTRFMQLLAEYDETDKKIYGLEQQSQPVSDDYFGTLKRRRALLKDQLYTILRRHSFS